MIRHEEEGSSDLLWIHMLVAVTRSRLRTPDGRGKLTKLELYMSY